MASKSYLDKTGLIHYDEETKKRTAIFRGSMNLTNLAVVVGHTYLLSDKYKVGSNCLSLFYCGEKMRKDVDYEEVGSVGSISNNIKFLKKIGDTGMSRVPGFEDFEEVLEYEILGDYN